MAFIDAAGLRFYRFESFPDNLVQAVFTRRGGVSPHPWESLNVGATVGDAPEHVRANRMRSFEVVGRGLESMFDVWQVHSADFVMTRAPRKPDEDYRKADIILTDQRDVTLYMRFADCVPVFLYDPVKAVVGMAHAGWLGTVRGTARAAVDAMRSGYGCDPGQILAAIGPSIGVDHYEVGPDVLDQVRGTFGRRAAGLVEMRDGKSYLDLWAANKLQLEDMGVEHIEVAGLCTACHTEDWFSHRAEKGKTGRFGALIALPA